MSKLIAFLKKLFSSDKTWSEKSVYLLFFVAVVTILSLLLVKCADLKINVKYNVNFNIGDIDTTQYDLRDHMETIDIDSFLRTGDFSSSAIYENNDVTMEQMAYLMDYLGRTSDIENEVKHRTNFYFIHCTASKEGVDLDGDWFAKFFEKNRGWSRPGYSAIVLLDGTLDTLRPFNLDCHTSIDEFTYGVRSNH